MKQGTAQGCAPGRDGDRSYLRFLGKGGLTAAGSLVDDFRMEFDMRLEAPVVHEIAVAMINFRNYFDRRYCLIVEPEALAVEAAWVRHGQLDGLRCPAHERARHPRILRSRLRWPVRVLRAANRRQHAPQPHPAARHVG